MAFPGHPPAFRAVQLYRREKGGSHATHKKQALEMLHGRMAEFTTIFPGHKEPLPADFINDQIACVKGILDGSLERKPYEMSRGTAMESVFGRATVIFNPDNL